MKFKAIIPLLVSALCLTSCGSEECKPLKLDENMSFKAEIVQDSKNYTAKFTRKGNAGWQAVMISPKTVKGMEIDLFSSTYSVNFGELSYSGKRDEMSEYSMISLICSAMDKCIGSTVESTQDGDIVTEKSSVNNLNFSVDFKDNIPKSITISDYLTADFKA
ncbi:MAG: hypothetical protein ACI4RN_00045 [Oscillospiraceae bacterium]